MKLSVIVIEALLCCLSLRISIAAPPETPWDALRHLSRHHDYTVLKRDGSCMTGTYVSVSDDSLVIEQDGEQQIPRANILRVSLGETPDVHTAVYSARSSWADLVALQSPPYFSNLMLITADARQFTGPLIGVTSDELTLTVNGKEMVFAKPFVARVFLTGKKPAFEESRVHWSNPVSLTKKVISPMQPVPLYEVTTQEDNSHIECSPVQRRPQ